jgi:hypothetical protein
MINRRWLAAFTMVLAIFLLIEGGWTAQAIDAVRQLEPTPNTMFATAQDVAWAKSHLPGLYVVAAEGFLFGVIAIVGAIAVLAKKRWAHPLLLVASILLTLTASVAIVTAPQKWDTQSIFIAWCLLFWWTSWKSQRL